MKKLYTYGVLLVLFCPTETSAQGLQKKQPVRVDQQFIFFTGGIYSKIDGLKSTILSEPFFMGYKDAEDYTPRYFPGIVGMGLDYRFNNSSIGLRHEIAYTQQWGQYNLDNYTTDFKYKMLFKYNYLTINTLLKIHFSNNEDSWFYNLNLSFGPQFGYNLTPENITYKSDGAGRLPAFGSDLEQQQQLRNVLKGKNNLGITGGISFAPLKNIPLVLEFRGFKGFSDLIETQANAYNFIEYPRNYNTSFQATIGYGFTN